VVLGRSACGGPRGWIAIEPFTCDFLPSRVVFGAGSLGRLRDEVDALGCDRVLLIAGGSTASIGARAGSILGDLIVGTHTDVRQHVPEGLAAAAVEAARGARADGVVTVGGGSTIGLGKVVAVNTEAPLLAVPTTYSGSEMTPVYGITGERKVTRRDVRAMPRTVIYDAELTTGLPPRVTATSGLNALAQCMEAIVGPGATPVSALAACEASSILPDALRACIRDGTDLEARSRAQYGGFMAGRSIGLARVGLQHQLAHILGGRFGLVHADVHAVLLPYVAEFHERDESVPTSRFARALSGGADVPAAQTLRCLAVDTGAPRSLAELGMPHEGIDVAVGDLGDARDPVAIRALLEEAFEPMMRGSAEGGAS
jgi:maleylacetate reductase